MLIFTSYSKCIFLLFLMLFALAKLIGINLKGSSSIEACSNQTKERSRTWYSFKSPSFITTKKFKNFNVLEYIHEFINTYLYKYFVFYFNLMLAQKVQNITYNRYKMKTDIKYQLIENCISNLGDSEIRGPRAAAYLAPFIQTLS